MAKIARKNQKIFASGASNNGQFGSAQSGTKVTDTDLDVLQALAAFLSGWTSATLTGENLPTLEEMQALHYITTTQIAYLFQEGVAEYNTDTSYYINSIVKKTGTYELYGSKIIDNLGNALPAAVDDANWQYLGDVTDLKLAASIVDATTTAKGIVELATGAEVATGTDTGRVAPVSAMVNHSGVAKACVNFNGNPVSIRDSYNVTSITDNGVGDYTVNWDTDFANINYSVNATVSADTIAVGAIVAINTTAANALAAPTVGSFRMMISTYDLSNYDMSYINVSAFGEQ